MWARNINLEYLSDSGKDQMKPDVEGNFLEPLRSIKKGNISILL